MYTSARASAPRLADLRALVPSALVASSYPESIILSRIDDLTPHYIRDGGGEGRRNMEEEGEGRKEGGRRGACRAVLSLRF